MKLNYGDIKADAVMRGEIEALGVTVAGYNERGRFVVSYPDSAIPALKEMERELGREQFSAFPPGRFDATAEGDLYKTPEEMDRPTAAGHLAYLQFRIAATSVQQEQVHRDLARQLAQASDYALTRAGRESFQEHVRASFTAQPDVGVDPGPSM